jgi:hypothetical protein
VGARESPKNNSPPKNSPDNSLKRNRGDFANNAPSNKLELDQAIASADINRHI